MARRQRREWEAEYVSEYVHKQLPGYGARFHVRLGTWPQPLTATELTESERAMLQVRMRWADAVVIMPEQLLVIEAKLRPSEFLKGLGELALYTHLVPHTTDLQPLLPRQVRGRLVIPLEDPTVRMLGAQQGQQTAVYEPTFWAEYLAVLTGREKRPIRPEEAELIKARRLT